MERVMRVDDKRLKANRSPLYNEWQGKDLMHKKKGKAFQDTFDKAFGLEAL